MRILAATVAAAGLAITFTAPAGSAAATPSTAAAAVTVGSVALSPCGSQLPGYCGSVGVPLDWQAPASAGDPDITVGFEWLPATGAAEGTIVTIEGGPGYSSTGSEGQYAAMVGPLAAHHNTLVFDLRGTGLSTPIKCSALQNYTGVASGSAFDALVGDCGAKLNRTWKNSAGRYVQASDLFATANAARDLNYTLGRLDLKSVDLYGDSYGSWFAQAFASRYPQDLRTVTLDSTYPVLNLDPWSTATLTEAEYAFNASCTRSPACAAQVPGGAWQDITALAEKLDQEPLTGNTVGLDDAQVTQTVDTRVLIDLVENAGFDPAVYSQLDAAARAYLHDDDGAPLLRLAAWSVGYDNDNGTVPSAYSDGVYFATVCTDYPELYDMADAPATRDVQFQAAIAKEPADAFAPFTPAQWVTQDAYNNVFDACLDWPSPTANDPPVTADPPLIPSSVPVLILSGDLDAVTPPAWNTAAEAQVGSSARYIEIPNITHVTALPDAAWPNQQLCGDDLYRQFVTDPAKLDSLDTSCTASTPPTAVLGEFPLELADVAQPTVESGNQAGPDGLRAASVGASTVADAMARSGYLDGSKDLGLRGGSWKVTGSNTLKFTLTADQWATDASVSGTATWNLTTGAVDATLTISYDGGHTATVDAAWNTLHTLTPAQLTGTADGDSIAAAVAVP
ncbi:alpha/beta hydrolase [Streptacidiphilus albus]|uniref:alpha/beta hydrolase n=1 Tax=Streptacidiphilus albus TaxID=105425 RepID=UPI00054BC554|nr:alpha/beta hydrolase [Streptacidiphilus albus]